MEFRTTSCTCRRFLPYGVQVLQKRPWYPQELCNDFSHSACALTLGESNVIKYGIGYPLRTGLDPTNDETVFIEKTILMEMGEDSQGQVEEHFICRGVCLVSHGPIGGPSYIKGLYRPLTSYGTGVGIESVVKAYFPRQDESASAEHDVYICLVEKAGISLYAEESSETHVSHVPEFQIDHIIPCAFGLLVVPLRGTGKELERGIYVLTNPIKQVSKVWLKNRSYCEYDNDNEKLVWCENDLCVFWSMKNDRIILRRLTRLGKADILHCSTLNTTPFTTSQDISGRAHNFATSSTSLFSPFPKHSLNQQHHRSAMRINKEGSTICYWPAFDFSNASLPGLGVGFFPPHVCVYDDPEIYLSSLFEIELSRGPWKEPRKFGLMTGENENTVVLLFLIKNHLYVEGVDVNSGTKLSRYAMLNVSDFCCPLRTKWSSHPRFPGVVILQTDGSVRICWLDDSFKVAAVSLIQHEFPEKGGYAIKSLDYMLFDCSRIVCTLQIAAWSTEESENEIGKHDGKGVIELRNFARDGLVWKCYTGLKEVLKSDLCCKILARFIASGESGKNRVDSDWKDFVKIILGAIAEEGNSERQFILTKQVLEVLTSQIQVLKVQLLSTHYLRKLSDFRKKLVNLLQQKHTHIGSIGKPLSFFSIFYNLLTLRNFHASEEYDMMPAVLQILLCEPDSTTSLAKLAEARRAQECLAPVFELLVSDVFYCNKKKVKFGQPETILKIMGRSDYVSGSNGDVSVEEDNPKPDADLPKEESDEPSDEPEWTTHVLLKRVFSEDRRLEEVCRLLDSSTPLVIDVDQRAEMSDHELVEEQEKLLLQQVQIVLSAPVGRAAFTLRTEKKLYSNLTTTIVLPKLSVTGRCATKGTTVELNDTDIPVTYTSWPNFHNAVAAALSVKFNDSPADAWFAYTKATSQEGPEQAGMVLGFGLNGILNSMPPTLKHEHLARENSFTSMSILLGLAANLAGTGDMSTWKLISLHIGAMLPACTTELEIPRLATLVAPSALGLLFIGTHNSHIAKVLLGEISKKFSPLSVFAGSAANNSASTVNVNEIIGVSSDREAHSLCAGFGLGFVSLGKGRLDCGNLIEDGLDGILRRFVVGGPKPAHMNPEDDENQFGQTMPSMWEEYRCCHIEEGENVNVDVTTPSAIIAVALIYLRSGNEAVLRWLSPPKTLHLLDGVRPDLLMLRALALMLVYDDVSDFDTAWLEENIMPEALLENALKQPEKHSRIDHESINQAWASIVCGYSLGMAIRFAGTANKKVIKMIWNYTNLIIHISSPESKLSEYFPKNFLESCICTLLIALSLIQSGTGDVAVLRLCRFLQSKVANTPITTSNNTYGLEMCISMATGILFLGGGNYSLSNDDRSVAVILASVFPKWPINASDNRYHLQALRHLYVLAAQPRLILPTPMPFGSQLIFHIETVDGKTTAAKAPVLLPPFHLIRKIWMDNSEFLPIEFSLPEDLPYLKKVVEEGGCLKLVNEAIGSEDHKFLNQMEWRQNHKYHSTFEATEQSDKNEIDEIKAYDSISRTAIWNGMECIISPLLALMNGNTEDEDWIEQVRILQAWSSKRTKEERATCLTEEQIGPLLKKANLISCDKNKDKENNME